MRLRVLLWRAVRLNCPACGEGKLFSGWFRMRPACPHCGFKLAKEPGFYLGSIYVNYGLTAVITMAIFFASFLIYDIPPDQMLWPLTAFCVVFPLWFFRYARSLWLAFDSFYDPDSAGQPREEKSL